MLKPGKIQLYPSGTMLDLTNLSKHITLPIHDVACGLSNITRFCGATKEALSVAQHSLSVAHVVNNTLQRWYDPSEHKEFIRAISFAALMHDAHEALGILDMPSPVKHLVTRDLWKESQPTRTTSALPMCG